MISVIRTLPERHAPRAARVLRAPGQTVATSATGRPPYRTSNTLLEGPSGLIHVELLPYHLTAAAKYPFTGRAHVGNQPA